MIAGALSLLAIHRFTLTYNEQGRYFDPSSSMVYDVDARLAYTVLAVFFWLLAGLFFALFLWLRRPRR